MHSDAFFISLILCSSQKMSVCFASYYYWLGFYNKTKKAVHLYVHPTTQADCLTESFITDLYVALDGFIPENVSKIKYILYEETIFYENGFQESFSKLRELISNSYKETIHVNNDLKTGWILNPLKNL